MLFYHQIYPRVGDIVANIHENPSGEQKLNRVRIKSILSNAIGVDKVCLEHDHTCAFKIMLAT